MKKSFVALLLFMGVVASSANPAFARVEDGEFGTEGLKLMNAQMAQELRSRASNLGSSAENQDTTYVGYTPGFKTASNYWSIWAGFGKDGYHRPTNGVPHKGMWDWEATEPGGGYINADSLQGWWPAALPYTSTGGLLLSDRNRPWWALEMGNQANYRINGASGRTFGVIGVWHVDAGANQAPTGGGGMAPAWAPLDGTASAWMGLRAHGDLSYTDAITGNPFNEDVMMFTTNGSADADGSDNGFPGYGSQMDQMLYRDISFQGKKDQDLTVKFKYAHRLSLGFGSTASTRVGWFDGDPLGVTAGGPALPATQRNNFISSTDAGNNAPRDSFMVYIGAGVDGNQWLASDGNTYDVYDPQRRWFAEVLHWDRDPGSDPLSPQPAFYRQLLSAADTTAGTVSATYVIPNSVLAPMLAKNNKIRLVFRVKTNRGFDDQGNAYSSNRLGAAQVDDVRITIGTNPEVVLGAFESPSEINNDVNVSALDAWKSTGKPPAVYHHVHEFATLLYEDICGQKGDISRECDMSGVVISGGDHDNLEEAGGPEGTLRRETLDGMFSPTIQFVGPYNLGPNNDKNNHGLKAAGSGAGDIVASQDMYVDYDMYAGIMDPFNKGVLWQFGFQSWPAAGDATHGSYKLWGNVQTPSFIIFNPDQQCFRDLEEAIALGLIKTSNTSKIPDSLKIMLRKWVTCFRFGVTTGCRAKDGVYWDNVSLTLIDGLPSEVSVDIWDWFNDAFPANEDDGLLLSKAAFDTTSAYVRTGFNSAQATGNQLRATVPGDSVEILTSAATQRVDMVFRVLPGPGNYHPIGDGHSGTIRRVPTNPATVTPFDGSWWDVYRRIPGEVSSAFAGHGGMLTGKGGWDPSYWLSARCDTSEVNLYAFQGRGVLGGPADNQNWMSTYHEADPHLAALGIVKNKCFVRCSTCATTDIICDGTVPTVGTVGGYLPIGTPATTTEGTKIIPDGLLAPGAHVQYFFRNQTASTVPGPLTGMVPDTNRVSPQIGEGSTDGHRWQQFSVLPDRWKDQQYTHPVFQKTGRGPACLLVVDNNDRRGNERVWMSIADTIGAVPQSAWGAHSGWHARGDGSVNDAANNIRPDGNPGYTVLHGGQPGSQSAWDMYQVKASESLTTSAGSLGSRLSNRSKAILEPKASRNGPTPAMLNRFYTLMLIMTGDLNSGTLGPYNNRSNQDAGIIRNWLDNGNTAIQTRGIWAIGDGFVEDNDFFLNHADRIALMSTYFRVALIDPNYQVFASNSDTDVDLVVYPEWMGKDPGAIKVYGMRNNCFWTNDVLDVSTPLLTSVTAEYQKKGGPQGGPYYSGVFKDWDSTSPWKALVDGWDIEHITSRNDVNTIGRSAYFLQVFTNVWAKIWPVAGNPLVPLDVPSGPDGGLINFVNLRNNPLTSGSATIDFGLAKEDRVEVKVYDVSGRLVRTLADRVFQGGAHKLTWDGVDNAGRQVARGVYFTKVRYHSLRYESSGKLTVLK